MPSNPPLLLGPRDRSLRLILLLTVALQAATWYAMDGYQLADSVEYMERAFNFVRGEQVVDNHIVRPAGFSALLLPFFAVARWIGVKDYTSVVWLVRILQMSLGLGLVVVAARIGERLGGRSAGLLAAVFVGANPVFLQFSVSPLADIAGSLGIALAIESVLDPPLGLRGGLRTGLLMGLALLMAYKTAPLSAVLAVLVLLRDRRRAGVPLLGMLLSLGACVLLQAGLDKLIYGRWALSLDAYFGQNIVSVVARLLTLTGFEQPAHDLYRWYYHQGNAGAGATELGLAQIQPTSWYLVHLPQMLAWPALAALAAGVVRSLRRRSLREGNWSGPMLIALTAAYLFLLHQKGSKEFRLWLPLLATLGPLAGLGLAWLLGEERRLWRSSLVGLLLAATVWLGFQAGRTRNTRVHSGYWKALDYIEEVVARERAENPDLPRARLASAYHWAVFLRTSADIELEKLPHQIDTWHTFDDEKKFEVFPVIEDQDWFIIHQPILTNPGHGDLTYRLNAWFQVEAVFYERAYEDLGPILVLRRRRHEGFDPSVRSLFERQLDVSPDQALAVARELDCGGIVHFVKKAHGEELWMLGYTYEELPGSGHGWLSTWWYNPRPFLADYTLVTRLTSYDERNSWQINSRPAWGVFPTDQWQRGTLLRDSRLVVAAADPYLWKAPYRPMGGAYRRGDYMPAFLWVDLATFYLACSSCGKELAQGHTCGGVERDPAVDGVIEVSGRLERAREGEDSALRRGDLAGIRHSPEGWLWSTDDLAQVGRFFLPVDPAARVPDDGRPIPD